MRKFLYHFIALSFGVAFYALSAFIVTFQQLPDTANVKLFFVLYEEGVKLGLSAILVSLGYPAAITLSVVIGFGGLEFINYVNQGILPIDRVAPLIVHVMTGFILWRGFVSGKIKSAFLINVVMHFLYNVWL